MNPHIKVAGLGCYWTEKYATLYKNKLCEVGFDTRLLYREEGFFVAYSHRSFTLEEAEKLLKSLLGEIDEVE